MQKMKNKKLLFYKILLIILLIAIVVVGILAFQKYKEQNEYEEMSSQVVEVFNQAEQKVDEAGLSIVEFKGYKVIGIIKIPKIKLEYPILEQTTKASMLVSISRFWGGDINSYGNVSLAGHNNRVTLTMFGKNKYLEIGDSIFLTDLNNQTIEYKIYQKFTTDPNDVSILETKDKTIREVTLITCSKGHENRLILKAKEVI